jgi:hypothetical protein
MTTDHPVDDVDRTSLRDLRDELDQRPPPPPAATAWPRDDVEVTPQPIGGHGRFESGPPPASGPDRDDVGTGAEPYARSESDDELETDADADADAEVDTEHDAVGIEPRRTDPRAEDESVAWIDDPEDVRLRWQTVQVGFVDNPRGAMDDAGKLVDEVVDLVVTGVAAQRDRLGESWSAEELDTEQLRLALRRYREFLDRLLAV